VPDPKIQLGPTGEAVMRNVKRLREGRRMTFVELSERLGGLGRPVPVLGLRRIERGERRVDVDDLFALSVVLRVSPLTLLLPWPDDPSEVVEITGIGSMTAQQERKR
jgi:transcriptional regulator with XRE-family HTH domain